MNEKKADLINKIKRRKRKLLGKEPINPEENGLRRRVRNLNFYEQASFRLSPDENKLDFSWDTDLCERFLSIRPTIAQLLTVLGLRELIIDSKKKHRNIGYVPALIHIPDKPGWVRLRYDETAYIELLKSETEKRKGLRTSMIERHNTSE